MLSTELSERDFRRFSALVYEKCGINLHQGKKELVRARLAKRLSETGFKNFNAYYRFVTQQNSGDELVKMLDAGYLFIGHSETLTGIDHRFRYIRPSVYQKR